MGNLHLKKKKLYVYLRNWSPVAKEMLQPAHKAGRRGSCPSPHPASPGTLPSNQQLSQGGEKQATLLLPRHPYRNPCTAVWSLLVL